MTRLARLLPLLLLLACTPAAPEPPVPAATPLPYPTDTIAPSPTLSPTSTSSPSPTSVPSRTPPPYPTPTEGWQGISVSPNGEWVAWYICCSDYGPYLSVRQVGGPSEWDLYFDTEKYKYFDGYISTSFWAPSGRYLYVQMTPPIHGPYCHFGGTIELQRLDLLSGHLTNVIPYTPESFFSFEFSQDGTRLAYIISEGQKFNLTIRNLQTGLETRILIPRHQESTHGFISWNPENSYLLFQTCEWDAGLVSLVLVNVLELSNEILFENLATSFYPIEWVDANQAVLTDEDSEKWLLNIETGELTTLEE